MSAKNRANALRHAMHLASISQMSNADLVLTNAKKFESFLNGDVASGAEININGTFATDAGVGREVCDCEHCNTCEETAGASGPQIEFVNGEDLTEDQRQAIKDHIAMLDVPPGALVQVRHISEEEFNAGRAAGLLEDGQEESAPCQCPACQAETEVAKHGQVKQPKNGASSLGALLGMLGSKPQDRSPVLSQLAAITTVPHLLERLNQLNIKTVLDLVQNDPTKLRETCVFTDAEMDVLGGVVREQSEIAFTELVKALKPQLSGIFAAK